MPIMTIRTLYCTVQGFFTRRDSINTKWCIGIISADSLARSELGLRTSNGYCYRTFMIGDQSKPPEMVVKPDVIQMTWSITIFLSVLPQSTQIRQQ